MRIGSARYRWEFLLHPGETAADYRDMTRLHSLLAPWVQSTPIDEFELLRVAEYTFRAQLADRWRDRRVFLLGDAAHLTPPFIGQGMGAGIRDAMNLAWKLSGVLSGHLPETVLDTYQAERKPHARALIRLAKLVGTAMTAGGELGNLIRREVAPRLRDLPRFNEHLLCSETPALHRSALVMRPRLRRTLAGRQCPNAPLDDGRRFDDVTAGRFSLVTATDPTLAQRADIERRGCVVVAARPGTELGRWLRRGHARAAIVRPDGAVLRAGDELSVLCAALPAFTPKPTPTADSAVSSGAAVTAGAADLLPLTPAQFGVGEDRNRD
jgi:3-(3-hydroxy-phenyl)propionate hydroxylase